MIANAKLPGPVHAVGDRIGLSYEKRGEKVARQYIEESKGSTRLDFGGLRKSYYSLDESRTSTKSPVTDKKGRLNEPRNPLKLNSKIRKQLYKITEEDKKQFKYCDFERVHELWLDYARKVCNVRNILRMDLHGCKLTCTASKNPTLIGIEGIVVQETMNTFIVIKESNALVILPKRDSLFDFKIDNKLFRIHGCNLLFSAKKRTKVKYKDRRSVSDI